MVPEAPRHRHIGTARKIDQAPTASARSSASSAWIGGKHDAPVHHAVAAPPLSRCGRARAPGARRAGGRARTADDEPRASARGARLPVAAQQHARAGLVHSSRRSATTQPEGRSPSSPVRARVPSAASRVRGYPPWPSVATPARRCRCPPVSHCHVPACRWINASWSWLVKKAAAPGSRNAGAGHRRFRRPGQILRPERRLQKLEQRGEHKGTSSR
jgi:hypothetical protein